MKKLTHKQIFNLFKLSRNYAINNSKQIMRNYVFIVITFIWLLLLTVYIVRFI